MKRLIKKFVCCECGSDDLEITAKATWDIFAQDFTYEINENWVFCNKCESETMLDEVEVDFYELKRKELKK